MAQIANLFSVVSYVSYIVLLLALGRPQTDDSVGSPAVGGPAAMMLVVLAMAAVGAWGLFAAFNAVRLLTTPYTYLVLREVAAHSLRQPIPYWRIAAEAVDKLIASACFCTAPYVVYKSVRRDPPDDPGPQLIPC